MKVILVFFAIFCCTIFATSRADDMTCFQENVFKPCLPKCENKNPDQGPTTKNCCIGSRCAKCMMDASSKCSSLVQYQVKQTVDKVYKDMRTAGCTESQMYPSTKCLHYFYTAWFYVVPLLIVAVIGGVVAFVVIRRRRRF